MAKKLDANLKDFRRDGELAHGELGVELLTQIAERKLVMREAFKVFVDKRLNLSETSGGISRHEAIMLCTYMNRPHNTFREGMVLAYYVFSLTPETARGAFQEFLTALGSGPFDPIVQQEFIVVEDLLGLRRGTVVDADALASDMRGHLNRVR